MVEIKSHLDLEQSVSKLEFNNKEYGFPFSVIKVTGLLSKCAYHLPGDMHTLITDAYYSVWFSNGAQCLKIWGSDKAA